MTIETWPVLTVLFFIQSRKTDERYSNFILWNDKRTSEICHSANASFSLFTIKKLTQIYSRVIPNHHMKAIAKYKMETTHVSLESQAEAPAAG